MNYNKYDAIQIINNLENYLLKKNYIIDHYIYRISMEQDYKRVQEFGSSRIGISDKLWYKNEEIKIFNKENILHQDVIIGSFFGDLKNDVLLDDGTFLHKLKIYKNPFISIYKKEFLLYLCEEDGVGQQNKGSNFLFLKNPKEVLVKNIFLHKLKDKYE